jgi:hypothetical protein
VVGATALIGLAVLLCAAIAASLDPGPAVMPTSRTTLPPITTRLVIPTVAPLRVPPVGPRPTAIRIP